MSRVYCRECGDYFATHAGIGGVCPICGALTPEHLAWRADQLLRHGVLHHNRDPVFTEDLLIEQISNLLHLAESTGEEPQSIMDRAWTNYENVREGHRQAQEKGRARDA